MNKSKYIEYSKNKRILKGKLKDYYSKWGHGEFNQEDYCLLLQFIENGKSAFRFTNAKRRKQIESLLD